MYICIHTRGVYNCECFIGYCTDKVKEAFLILSINAEMWKSFKGIKTTTTIAREKYSIAGVAFKELIVKSGVILSQSDMLEQTLLVL